MDKTIEKIYSNYIESGLERFFSERITQTLTDPHANNDERETFSFRIDHNDIRKGIYGSNLSICLAFKRMMEKMYDKSHSFSLQETGEDTFYFVINLDPKEADNIAEMMIASANTVEEKIVYDIIRDKNYLKRDLRNGIIPPLDYFCPKSEDYHRHIFDGNIVDCFSLRSVHINRYHLILRGVVGRKFPELMSEQLEDAFSKVLYL